MESEGMSREVILMGYPYLYEDVRYNAPIIVCKLVYNSILSKRLSRTRYSKMWLLIVEMKIDGYSNREISRRIKRSPERVRQILWRFCRELRKMVESDSLRSKPNELRLDRAFYPQTA